MKPLTIAVIVLCILVVAFSCWYVYRMHVLITKNTSCTTLQQLKSLQPQSMTTDLIRKSIPLPCYYINLDRSPERRKFMEQLTEPIKDRTTRVSAIDGKKHTETSMDGVLYVTNYKLSNSQIACSLSHIKTLQLIEEAGHDAALVMEDDASFELMPFWPKNYIQTILKEIPDDVGIVQLYWGRHSEKWCNVSDTHKLQQVTKPCYGTVAYIVTRRGVQDILAYTLPDRNGPVQLISTDGFPECGAADMFLYQLTKVYNTSLPIMVFDNSDFESTITTTVDLDNLRYFANILNKYIEKTEGIDYK